MCYNNRDNFFSDESIEAINNNRDNRFGNDNRFDNDNRFGDVDSIEGADRFDRFRYRCNNPRCFNRCRQMAIERCYNRCCYWRQD